MVERLRSWISPAACTALFVGLAVVTWRSLGDVVIDLGTDLYLAWRLHEGDALYRDLAYRNGPLSPHLNALWFSAFGVSLRTLMLANLAILAGTCALVHRLLARTAGPAAAGAAVAVFLVCFGFAHLVEIGTYNWVAPYQHAQTHGVALGFVVLAAFATLLRGPSLLASVLAGAGLGLAFLTKSELFVPVAGAFVAGTAAFGFAWGRSDLARHLLAALAAGAIPVAAFTVGLGREIGAAEAWRGVLGNWVYLGAGIADDPFYRRGLGLDDPGRNALGALVAAATLGAFAAGAAGLDRLAGERARGWPAGLVFVASVVAFALVPRAIWVVLARGLPVAMVALAVLFAASAWRARGELGDREAFARPATLAIWAVLALALLGKMLLNARIEHYGFSLALPATLLLVASGVGLLPAWLAARGSSGAVARALTLGALVAFAASCGLASHRWISAKTHRVASGADALWVDPGRGGAIDDTLEALAANTTESSSLLVVPEGSSLNYWLRRRTPGRHHLFLPTELDAYGPERVLAEIEASPPDVAVLIARSYDEFDRGRLASDPRYGRDIARYLLRTTERVGGTSEEAVAAGALRVEIRLRSSRRR